MARPFNPDLLAEPEPPSAYSVSELNAIARQLLERNFRGVYVVGEVSNVSLQPSGHLYFTMKDAQSQINAVMWRESVDALGFRLEPGMEVLAMGDVTLYARWGQYQLSVKTLEPRGAGRLDVAFRQLRDRLEAEGLFDASRKKPLPALPRRICLVTSPAGAAVRDMLKSICDRFPRAHVTILPVQVQGPGAAAQIAEAIRAANELDSCDVIVTGRGGGSLEDLWAFNEEPVARAIASSRVPVVCAVGHERDVTISDLVADRRAMTPTQVGSLVVPDEREVLRRLAQARARLVAGLSRRAVKAADDLERARRHPGLSRPERMLEPFRQRLANAFDRAARAMDNMTRDKGQRLSRTAVALESLSPLGVLARGYSVTRDPAGNVIKDASGLREGDVMETILHRGRVRSVMTRRICEETEDGKA